MANPTTPAKTSAAGFLSSEFFLLAFNTLLPLALTALGHAPNPIMAAVGVAASAIYAAVNTWLKSKHLGTKAEVEAAVGKVLSSIETVTGKDVFNPDMESAIEFGAAAIAEQADVAPAPAPAPAPPANTGATPSASSTPA